MYEIEVTMQICTTYDRWTVEHDSIESLSSIVHHLTNLMQGDSYGWFSDNINKQEMDQLFNKGQRFFILSDINGNHINVCVMENCKPKKLNPNINKLVSIIENLCFEFDPKSEKDITNKALEFIDSL